MKKYLTIILSCLSILALAQNTGYDITVRAVNHRGYNPVAPENTLSAYRLSKQHGFTYVETDVQFTSDNIPVLLHDNTIDRTSNGTGALKDKTLAELRTYDFGSWKSEAFAGEQIPTLDAFLSLCHRLGLLPYIEIKTATQEQLSTVLELVDRHGMRGKVCYISFMHQTLKDIAMLDPEARLGYLVTKLTAQDIDKYLQLRNGRNEVFADVNTFTPEALELLIANHIPLEVWTYDTEESILALPDYVTGVTSDNLIAGKVYSEGDRK